MYFQIPFEDIKLHKLLNGFVDLQIFTILHYMQFCIISSIQTSHCNFSKMFLENQQMKSHMNDLVWHERWKKEMSSPPKNICQQISTYIMFLERNINTIMSNASCTPRTTYNNQDIYFNNSKRMKGGKINKRFVQFLLKRMSDLK